MHLMNPLKRPPEPRPESRLRPKVSADPRGQSRDTSGHVRWSRVVRTIVQRDEGATWTPSSRAGCWLRPPLDKK